ncbi:MAG: c-type cytochrome [Gammaproteobacteria bacterium]|nr:c-type cytochrome [Gammaproteobacteria bacterium]MBL7000743.1 c-type cytochrome [Gammaproteobacteria bacterium]
MQSVSKVSGILKPLAAWIIGMALVAFSVSEQAFAEDESLRSYKPQLSDEFKDLLREAAQHPEQGEEIFMRKCSSCHDHKKAGGHGKGPHLWNVLGRQAGTVAKFYFSDAMSGSGHQWTLATLNYYLTNTEQAVPGRLMEFRGIRKDEERAKLIAFLRTLNDNPPALP